jgi:CheY-like chemotaxis protein
MQYRVREILLVSTPYDSYVLEEDGHLSDKIFSEYLDLNLQFVPRIAHASSAEEAFKILNNRTYDLVITMPRISDMSPLEFSRRVKEIYPDKPVVMLTYETLDEETLSGIRESKSIDRVFVWSGNSQILLAIIKYVEDRGNVEADGRQGVQVILVVDDSPNYYSQFLPLIYTEIMKQTRYLISHAVNNLHRQLRMRARPKILLAESYEEAMEVVGKYRNNIMGIISDIGFLKNGAVDKEAGLALAAAVKGGPSEDIPVLLQSQDTQNIEKAKKLGISCLDKNSPDLLKELRNYILDSYSFGEFVFKSSRGVVISSVSDISSFERAIKVLPEDSLAYHAARHHFSRWFRARTEFEVADELREREGAASGNLKEFREFMEDCIDRVFRRYQKGVIVDFGLSKMDFENSFIRLGNGSLGGKARGVAFFRTLITDSDLQKKYPDVKMRVPRSFVICSDVFEEFLHMNDLQEMAVKSSNEDEIAQRFLAARLPDVITDNLRVMINEVNYPLAVRSSSILEDSQVLPFAGIFKTYLLPNCDPNPVVRYKQLVDSVKLIYASAFFQSPKGYAKNADIRIEEGSMSVLIQQLVGEAHGGLFYPVISGVAQTWNYYPYSHMKPEQGIINLALGFGKVIVDGGRVYGFSPAYPKMNPPYGSPREFVENTQTQFYTLDLSESAKQLTKNEECTYKLVGLSQVEEDQTLQMVASTYLAENDLIMDTFNAPGPKLVTFADILKHKSFPLVDIVRDLFEMGKSAFGTDVEIEFAVNLPVDKEKTPEFYFLQIRPMVVGREARECRIEEYSGADVVCASGHIIGNGVYKDITDVIYIDPDRFEISKTSAIASEIGELNKRLMEEGRKCVLMGFGRLGTSDPWLGIPLVWWQMSQAKVVVEADLDNLVVEPSLGSHFHHNLTSLKMGFFHIGKKPTNEERINWENLRQAPVVQETAHARLVRFEKPLVIKVDGQCGQGVILKQD